jgi:hypothetical protein
MAQDYNRKLQFPTNDNYAIRITEAEFVESKRTGNPMIHYKSEVVTPATVDIGGKETNIAGVETDQYLIVTTLKNGEVDAEKTAANRERLETFWTNCGQDFSKFDTQNPDLSWMKGIVLLVAMGCDVEAQRKSPTPEQVANKQQGDIMKNPITGKDLVYYKPKVTEVFGVQPKTSGL